MLTKYNNHRTWKTAIKSLIDSGVIKFYSRFGDDTKVLQKSDETDSIDRVHCALKYLNIKIISILFIYIYIYIYTYIYIYIFIWHRIYKGKSNLRSTDPFKTYVPETKQIKN